MSSSEDETGVKLVIISRLYDGVKLKTNPRGWVATAKACDQRLCLAPPSFQNLLRF